MDKIFSKQPIPAESAVAKPEPDGMEASNVVAFDQLRTVTPDGTVLTGADEHELKEKIRQSAIDAREAA